MIFDLFGTLVDDFSFTEYRLMLSEMAAAVSIGLEDLERLWVDTFDARTKGLFATIEANIEHICRALGVSAPADRIAAAALIRRDFTRRSLSPKPDAVQTLAQLKASGYKTGLISDCSPEVPALWAETPFAPLVDVPVFSAAAGVKKPDPRIYLLACERLEVRPQDCLYVGDGSSRELTGASQVGMYAVLISVAYEEVFDSYAAYRREARDWKGPAISALSDVLALLQ